MFMLELIPLDALMYPSWAGKLPHLPCRRLRFFWQAGERGRNSVQSLNELFELLRVGSTQLHVPLRDGVDGVHCIQICRMSESKAQTGKLVIQNR